MHNPDHQKNLPIKQNNIYNSIKLFIAFSFFIVGALWIWTFFLHGEHSRFYQVIGCVGITYLFLCLISLALKNKYVLIVNILLTISLINYAYLFSEGAAYFYTGLGKEYRGATYYNKPCADYDIVSGYRFKGKHCRFVRIARAEVVYDQQFRINQQGFISSDDYTYNKKDPETIRFIVLGDSFTAGGYLNAPWPDAIQTYLNDDNQKYEFYSFALDGIGVSNWYEMFFKDIVPHYEFDVLVIASYKDNLYRSFGMAYVDETGGYFGNFESPPVNDMQFMEAYKPKMKKLQFVEDDNAIDDEIKKAKNAFFLMPPTDLYVLKKLEHVFRIIYKHGGKEKAIECSAIDDVKKHIGEKHFTQIEKIIYWCKKHNKDVIIVSIPSKQSLLQKRKSLKQEELKALSKYFSVEYFDAYSAFRSLSRDEIDDCWLVYDGHWNQKGSDRFSEYFAAFIRRDFAINKENKESVL